MQSSLVCILQMGEAFPHMLFMARPVVHAYLQTIAKLQCFRGIQPATFYSEFCSESDTVKWFPLLKFLAIFWQRKPLINNYFLSSTVSKRPPLSRDQEQGGLCLELRKQVWHPVEAEHILISVSDVGPSQNGGCFHSAAVSVVYRKTCFSTWLWPSVSKAGIIISTYFILIENYKGVCPK